MLHKLALLVVRRWQFSCCSGWWCEHAQPSSETSPSGGAGRLRSGHCWALSQMASCPPGAILPCDCRQRGGNEVLENSWLTSRESAGGGTPLALESSCPASLFFFFPASLFKHDFQQIQVGIYGICLVFLVPRGLLMWRAKLHGFSPISYISIDSGGYKVGGNEKKRFLISRLLASGGKN